MRQDKIDTVDEEKKLIKGERVELSNLLRWRLNMAGDWDPLVECIMKAREKEHIMKATKKEKSLIDIYASFLSVFVLKPRTERKHERFTSLTKMEMDAVTDCLMGLVKQQLASLNITDAELPPFKSAMQILLLSIIQKVPLKQLIKRFRTKHMIPFMKGDRLIKKKKLDAILSYLHADEHESAIIEEAWNNDKGIFPEGTS